VFYYGLALAARCHHAVAHTNDALDACDRFLTRWHQTGGYTTRAPELCELGLILAQATRHDIIRQAALLLPSACRWRDALLLTAEAKYVEAARVYENIGSHPLAADTHLLAAQQAAHDGHTAQAAGHAHAVLAFAQQTGATLYRHLAEQLSAASA
jgi:hypothetical protein